MRESGSDALVVLRWGLRRYVLLFVACLLLGAVAAPYAASKLTPPATAEALVITQRLDMSLTALPRYAQAVFNDGQVAAAVAQKYGHGVSVEAIIPGKVSLIADQDSIIFHVVGTDPDPQTAADLGIGMVHQHLSLVESLTVWENVLLGDHRRFDRSEARRQVAATADHYGLARSVEKPVGRRSQWRHAVQPVSPP